MRHFLFFSCLLSAFFLSGCVAPEQYQVLEQKIIALEQENSRREMRQKEEVAAFDQLRGRLDDDAKTTRENNAELKYEVQQIKEKFYRIQGQIEELQHNLGTSDRARQENVEKMLDRLDNAISKNYEKVMALEEHMGFEPSKPGSVPELVTGQTDSTPQIPTTTEDGLYGFAKKLFDDGERENARIQFENFINKYPGSKKADNARFWIADSYYAEKWYEKAILEYQKVLETYPDSNKAAASRLKQGYAFAALGETANARLILKELTKRHPDSKEAGYAREKLKNL